MLKTTSFIGSSTILKSLINRIDKGEVGGNKSGGNETNLLNPSTSKKSTRAGYLTLEDIKKGNGKTNSSGRNTKKSVKAAKSSSYLTPDVKKAVNHLQHVFIQTPILEHFNPQ